MKRRYFLKGVALATPGLALPLMAGITRHFSNRIAEGDWQTQCDTVCEVDPKLALKRETNFLNWKAVPVLNTTAGGSENLDIPVSPANFLNLLNTFVNSTAPRYNGVRMYFAACDQLVGSPPQLPASQVGKLTVIFVPTIYDANFGCIGGVDDFTQCWWLYDTIAFKFPPPDPAHPENDTVKRWIYNYRNNKRDNALGLSVAGQKYLKNDYFEDTASIWYRMESIGGSAAAQQNCQVTSQDCGIVGYLRDRITSIDTMKIAFGAYDSSEKTATFPYYQMLAQFDFHQTGTPMNKYFILGSSSGELFCKRKKMLYNGTTDTGLPCPPAPPCNGSGF